MMQQIDLVQRELAFQQQVLEEFENIVSQINAEDEEEV